VIIGSHKSILAEMKKEGKERFIISGEEGDLAESY